MLISDCSSDVCSSDLDVIELGMPFSDPMADGPAIQAASLRALKSGQKMRDTLALVAEFRKTDNDTPIVLMGYYNQIYVYPRSEKRSVGQKCVMTFKVRWSL